MTHLKPVEALAIDADDGTLTDERVGVNLVDELEDLRALALLGQHEQHLHLSSAIETLSVDDGAATVRVEVDAVTDLLIPLGDDEELHASAHGVHHLVDTEGRDIQHHVTIDHLLPVAQHEIAARDNHHIADQDHPSQGDVTVFVDDGGNDISTTRTTIHA